MANNQQIGQLLHKHLQGILSPEEELELESWASQQFSNRELLESLNNEEELMQKLLQHLPEERQQLRNRIFEKVLNDTLRTSRQETVLHHVRRGRMWKWMAAAAVVLAAAGIWYLSEKPGKQPAQIVQVTDTLPDIAPGSTGALLTLANGSIINLDSAANSTITAQSGANLKMENGQLSYEKVKQPDSSVSWNTITTPNGRQFTILLSDGTKIWLNAASSLRYPAVFTGKERMVTLQGEGYFEVFPDNRHPFRVNTADGTNVEVLGTAFNINAYLNEPVLKATLLQGSIRVRKENVSAVLKPGQQAIVKQNISLLNNIDTDQVIAWKNGYFNLNGMGLEELMRQISRWYNIEVSMEGSIPAKKFWGEIYRGEKLSTVLKFLKNSGIRFRMENNGAKLVLTN
ncbi:MAG: FecR family protein [Pseudobacter sp.]|uniref:FecR family protein n=1 Tax=Pseudobacter sp. TaxID=2045420 RepID=UPI003F816ABD